MTPPVVAGFLPHTAAKTILGPVQKLDHTLSRPIHHLKLGRLDYVLAVPGLMFGSYGMPVTILALALWAGWRFGAVAAMASVTTLALTGPLKHYFARPRPADLPHTRAVGLRRLVNNPAFPSGDSAQAAMLATLLVVVGPVDGPGSWCFAALVPLCMFSRVYYGAHWVGDTVAGAVLGIGVGAVYAGWFGVWVG